MNSKSVTSILNNTLNPARFSVLNSLMMLLKYPVSLLYFTHFLVFPLWGFSSSESTYWCNTASVVISAILNYWMNGCLNFWTLECWMEHFGWKCANGNIGFHPTSEIPSKISSNTKIKYWLKCWIHFAHKGINGFVKFIKKHPL